MKCDKCGELMKELATSVYCDCEEIETEAESLISFSDDLDAIRAEIAALLLAAAGKPTK